MSRYSDDEERPTPRRRTPARTPVEHESVLISKSLKLIEKQIDEGSVSSAVLSIYAKAGTERDRLEKERLRNENALLLKKVETMEAAVDVKNLMTEALQVFRGYAGEEDDEDEYDD